MSRLTDLAYENQKTVDKLLREGKPATARKSVSIQLSKSEYEEFLALCSSEGINESACKKIIWEKGVSRWQQELADMRAQN